MHTEIRQIVKYKNRKLYDKKDSTYLNVIHVAELVQNGETVQVIDNVTKVDITSNVLKQAYFDLLKTRNDLTSQTLHDKIKSI